MAEKTLESLTREGRKLLDTSGNPSLERRAIEQWVEDVSSWLDETASGTGLSADWSAQMQLPSYESTEGHVTYTWEYSVERCVRTRLKWLSLVPGKLAARGMSAAPPKMASPRMIAGRVEPSDRRIFLVHGRDDGTKEAVARFLEKLDLIPVILHEQPNGGRTIIEKFEHFAAVSFAVVLLTPDDVGGLIDQPTGEQKARARQNVIMELGFFLGALGRSNVLPLYSDGVELPSDYSGVVFIPLDRGGAWRSLMARELKAAGMDVDLNRAM